MDWNNFKFLKEGFARGVELIIAKSEAKTRGKSALVNTTLERLYEDITEFASNGYKEDAEKQLHYEVLGLMRIYNCRGKARAGDLQGDDAFSSAL